MQSRALAARTALIVALALSGTPFVTAARAEAVLDRDYIELRTPQPVDSAGKIEILEFFSYGCPHCAEVHPKLKAWEKQLPKDAVFKRIPVGFGRPAWVNLARAYYALEESGDLAKLDAPLYEAIHQQRQALVDGPSIAAWVGRNGGNAAAFTKAFDTSFSVRTKAAKAEQLVKEYQVMEVPKFMVGGRYSVVGHSEDQMLSTATELVAKARAAGQRNASR